MVITMHIDKWDVTKVFVDNGSEAEIFFLSAFDQIGFNRKQLKEVSKPLYSFSGKRIEPVGFISPPPRYLLAAFTTSTQNILL
jgi:hypothetical protein